MLFIQIARLLFILLALLLQLNISAQNIVIRGNVLPDYLEPYLFDSGPEKGEYAFSVYSGTTPMGYATSLELPMEPDARAYFKGEHLKSLYVRIELSAPGFKTKSWNLESSKVKENREIDLGQITLIANDMAEINHLELFKDLANEGAQVLRAHFVNHHRKHFSISDTEIELLIPAAFTSAGGVDKTNPEQTISISSALSVACDSDRTEGTAIRDGRYEMRSTGAIAFYPYRRLISVKIKLKNVIVFEPDRSFYIDYELPRQIEISNIENFYTYLSANTEGYEQLELDSPVIDLSSFGSIQKIILKLNTTEADDPMIYHEYTNP